MPVWSARFSIYLSIYLPLTLTAHLDAHRVAVGLLGRGLGFGPALRLELGEVLVELRAARALRETGRLVGKAGSGRWVGVGGWVGGWVEVGNARASKAANGRGSRLAGYPSPNAARAHTRKAPLIISSAPRRPYAPCRQTSTPSAACTARWSSPSSWRQSTSRPHCRTGPPRRCTAC